MGFCCGISLDLSGVSEGCEVATQKLHDRIGKNMKEQQLMEKKRVLGETQTKTAISASSDNFAHPEVIGI